MLDRRGFRYPPIHRSAGQSCRIILCMAAQPEPSLILSFEEARHVVEAHAARLRPCGKELADLLEATGQVLAEPIVADRNFPPFPRAARDGYALRAADLAKLPATLEVVAEIKAGVAPESVFELHPGKAAAIMTGAPAPSGADAVVMVEYTTRHGNQVEITKGVSAGDNIVPAGSEAKRGERLLSPGTRLDYAAVAVAASVGRTHLLVYSKPQIAVLSTGDEVVDIDVPPGPNQIRNSNSYSLAAQIQPGRPIVFGRVPRGAGAPAREKHSQSDNYKYFFGLPGNPVSTMVTFDLFVRPALDALSGLIPHKLIFLHAKLKSEIKTKTGLKRFLPAILSGEFEQAEVELARWQGSGDIAATARANCYVMIPPDRERIAAGEWVPVLMR